MLSRLGSELEQKTMKNELEILFKKIGTDSKDTRKAKGSVHQLLAAINRNIADSPDEITLAIEKRIDIDHPELGNHILSGRVYDEIVRILADNTVRHIDQKAWQPSYLERGLRTALSMKVNVNPENADDIGQLLKDTADFVKNKNTFKARYDFTAEMAGVDVAGTLIKLVEDPANKQIRANMEMAAGISKIKDDDLRSKAWQDFLKVFKPAVTNSLFKIDDYANIRKQLDI